MKSMKRYLLNVSLLIVLVRSHAADVSAPPEGGVASTSRSRAGWGKILSCFLHGHGRVCVMDRAYREAENWLDSAPEFRALALAEMERKDDVQKGILDYVGEVATYSLSRFVKYFIVGVKGADVYEDSQGEADDLRPNRDVPEGSHSFNPTGYTTRLVRLKTKKAVLLKFYVLAKLFIYGFIAKAKVAIVIFKVFLVLKLKFLALAVIHTLIALAKLNFQYKNQHMPEKMVSPGHEQQHYGNYHQQDYGDIYADGGVDRDRRGGPKYRGW